MVRSRRRARLAAVFGSATLLLLTTLTPALASGSEYRTISCSGGKTVNISSRASTNISHSWSGGNFVAWYNLASDLKISWTNYASTWAVLDYSSTWTSFALYCVQ